MNADATTLASRLDCGVAARPLPGETVSGDRHVVRPMSGGGTLLAVIDGLGHGAEAAQAADAAAAVLEARADEELIALMRRCHAALTATRGAAMSLVALSAATDTATWLGVGNVEAVVVRPDGGSSHLLMRGGIVGFQHLPPLRTSIVPIGPTDTLVMVTDGIAEGFLAALKPDDPPQRAADRILARYAKNSDDALVLVARCRGSDP
jgi:phosphoserine phosphatase RsbX